MYFICGSCDSGRYGAIMNEKQLKEHLIFEITNDIYDNIEDKSRVKSCVTILKDIATNKDNLNYIIDNLKEYDWKIIDLLQIQRDLEDLKDFFAPNVDSKLAVNFQNVLDTINKGVNE